MRRALLSGLLTGLCITSAALLLLNPTADAQVVIGAEGNVGTPVGAWSVEPGAGQGVQLRLGYALPAPGLFVVPELTGGHLALDPADAGGAAFQINNLSAGLRLGVDAPLRPSVFGHVGYGWLQQASTQGTLEQSGRTWDAGVALDFTLIPLVNLGVSAAWNRLDTPDPLNPARDEQRAWLTAGAHLEITF